MTSASSLLGGSYQVGDLTLGRLGFGAMQLAGPGVFGPPADRDQAVTVLREAVEQQRAGQAPGALHGQRGPGRRGPVDRASGLRAELLQRSAPGRRRARRTDGGQGIAFVPYFPLGGFTPLQSGELDAVARRLGVPTQSVALAWLLQQSPNMLVIPGTSSLAHLRENVASASLALDAETVAELDAIAG